MPEPDIKEDPTYSDQQCPGEANQPPKNPNIKDAPEQTYDQDESIPPAVRDRIRQQREFMERQMLESPGGMGVASTSCCSCATA
jgi:hypothetical protein